jgi:uncharacterized membrane protein
METILGVWVLTAAGIQLGTLWIMKLSILPMLNALPYDRYVNICQLIDMHVFHPIAVWNGIIATGLGIVAAVLVGGNSLTAAVLFVVGSVGMLVVGVTSEGVNRPIWRQIEKWRADDQPASAWDSKRRTWHLAHQVRTYGAIGAAAAYAVALGLIA